MNQLCRIEQNHPATAAGTLISKESLIVETPAMQLRTSTPLEFPTKEEAVKSSDGSLTIWDYPLPAKLENVAILEALKPKDSELVKQLMIPETGPELTIQQNFDDVSRTPMFVEPVLRALEEPSTTLEAEELDAAAAPEKVKVGVLRPVQQPGSYWDRSSELPLVGLEPTEVTAYD